MPDDQWPDDVVRDLIDAIAAAWAVDQNHGYYSRSARATLTALTARIPRLRELLDGTWIAVPVVATEHMMNECADIAAFYEGHHAVVALAAWPAMLAAVPTQKEGV